MNPTTQTKPVMDVATPKSPAPAFNPFARPASAAPAVAPKPAASELPVRPAPMSSAPAQSDKSATSSAQHSAPAKRPATAAATSHKPVALITVTVFVMLVLSVLAVTVYVTSQTV